MESSRIIEAYMRSNKRDLEVSLTGVEAQGSAADQIQITEATKGLFGYLRFLVQGLRGEADRMMTLALNHLASRDAGERLIGLRAILPFLNDDETLCELVLREFERDPDLLKGLNEEDFIFLIRAKDVDSILDIAKNIEEDMRAYIYNNIAAACAHCDDKDKAVDVFNRAIAETVNTVFIFVILRDIALRQAKEGFIDQALLTATKIQTREHKAEALARIGKALSEMGRKREAEEVFKSIEVPETGHVPYDHVDDMAARNIAEIMAGQGFFKLALNTIDTAPGSGTHKTLGLVTIGKLQAEAGLFGEAILTAKKINNELPLEQLEIYKAVTAVFSKKIKDEISKIRMPAESEKDGLKTLVDQIRFMTRDMSVDVTRYLENILGLFKENDYDSIFTAFRSLIHLLALDSSLIDMALEEAGLKSDSLANCAIMVSFLMWEGYEAQAYHLAEKMPNAHRKGLTYCDISCIHSEDGDNQKARQALGLAVGLSGQVDDSVKKSELNNNISRTYAAQGMIDEANQWLSENEVLATRSRAISGVFEALIRTKDYDEAAKLADSMPDMSKNEAYKHIAVARAEDKMIDEAYKSLAKIDKRFSGSSDLRTAVLCAIARTFIKMGRTEDARKTLLDAHLEAGNRTLLLDAIFTLQLKNGFLEDAFETATKYSSKSEIENHQEEVLNTQRNSLENSYGLVSFLIRINRKRLDAISMAGVQDQGRAADKIQIAKIARDLTAYLKFIVQGLRDKEKKIIDDILKVIHSDNEKAQMHGFRSLIPLFR